MHFWNFVKKIKVYCPTKNTIYLYEISYRYESIVIHINLCTVELRRHFKCDKMSCAYDNTRGWDTPDDVEKMHFHNPNIPLRGRKPTEKRYGKSDKSTRRADERSHHAIAGTGIEVYNDVGRIQRFNSKKKYWLRRKLSIIMTL